ncbi:MAG: alpha/beta hydrolase [Deltaproteobacteria bacterium]|nr:alpha/beta hydrolase [Deltaproteobacteria bacterium]MBW1955413.1 alpha/beta hydrolase [Deltaproteobacteria bacterium]MBW2042039.1 alpha/beta hydrolase [Deltaproteobacteria bacterium]MBW2133252.1 alpha/beta hydrolase [Deltaproteobacteria bacterium]
MKLSTAGKILLGIGGLYVAYGGVFFFLQRQLLFPRFLVGSPPENLTFPPGVEQMWIQTAFGPVEAYLMIPEKASATAPVPIILFAHGNGERIDFWPEAFSPFLDLGMGVFLVEYPGYGRSAGVPSQETVTETFVNAYDVLARREDVDSDRIVFVGRSLGGGAVCALAEQRPPTALILMSTFTSIRSFAPRYLLPPVLVRDPFDNLSVVRKFDGPVLVIHGDHDETIGYRHGVTLFENAKKGKMITYSAGHNDCPPDWGVFFKDVRAFLRSNGILP